MREVATNTYGTLSSAPDSLIVNSIYDYLSSILTSFKGKDCENENAITNRLCKTLNSRKPSEYPFFFHHQNIESEKENTSTDFAVFGTFAYAVENDIEDDDSPPLIKFEAKRLNSKLPKSREREYVCGEYKNGMCLKNSGGIERFKNGRHGADVSNAAIIGYLQSDSVEFWFTRVNKWIEDQISTSSDSRLKWDATDLLVSNSLDKPLSNYISTSSRLSGSRIRLNHFWIDFTNEN